MAIKYYSVKFLDKHEELKARLALLLYHGIIFHPEQDGSYIISEQQVITLRCRGIKIVECKNPPIN